jgi:hypothetical protein
MDSFNPKPFLRTLSFRDFTTVISLVLLLLAVFNGLEYYQYGWVADNLDGIKITLMILVLPINHIVYRLEHGRQNNLVGRSIHDCIFILLFLIARKIENSLFYGFSFHPYSVAELLTLATGIVVGIIIIEFIIALFKYWLSLAGWRIL